MTVADLTEAELISRIQSRLQPPPDWLVVGIGDDAAVVEPARGRLEVLTVDVVVDGVHFDRRVTPPDAVGHRALAVNLSDLAAMGASPRLALVSFVLPADLSCADFDGMVSGLVGLAVRHGVHVIGGNLTRSPGPLMVDVTVAGTVKRRQPLTRGGARPGDAIYVTGTIGGAAAGLQMLRDSDSRTGGARSPNCVRRYLYPEPRVRVGLLLGRNRGAVACMDLSDGLADGVAQIAEASGIGMLIEADDLPVDPDARRWFAATGQDAVGVGLTSSDDYELVFAAKPSRQSRLRAVVQHDGPMLTRIGVCTAGRDVLLRRTVDGVSVLQPMPRGYGHFRNVP